ncbi:2-dehydropantoate 2-reductase [Salinarchaeum chitinilyticum]
MDVLVIGAGSLGSLVGGLLAPDHDVTLLGREPHVEAVRESGLAIGGELEELVSPSATTDLGGSGFDLAIVAVKASDTERAAERLGSVDVDAVWSLQNGLDNEAKLAATLDAPVLAGTATYGADRSAPGSVTCTGLGELAIGPRPGTPAPEVDVALAERIGVALSGSADEQSAFGAHPRVVVDEAMPERLWLKLAVNAGINPVTALARVQNGALARGDAGDTAERAAIEVARVARASGIDLDDAEVVAELEAVIEATADNRSSMLQDVEAGRRTEIDAIAGTVIDRADEHGVSVPTVRTLASLVRAWERGQELR